MLGKVGQTQLILVLQHRAGIDHEAQFGPLFWAVIDPDVIPDAVGKGADGHRRIAGQQAVPGSGRSLKRDSTKQGGNHGITSPA